MTKFSENKSLQKDIWFGISTVIFLVVAFSFRSKDFMPFGIFFCVEYLILINIGLFFINNNAKKKKALASIENKVPLPDK
ncbi:hypothetical protein KAU33_04570 [Candidatus Dependentiae bacterium]|nr:hypothetical protein [Candidatus Dependentiae bacterium]